MPAAWVLKAIEAWIEEQAMGIYDKHVEVEGWREDLATVEPPRTSHEAENALGFWDIKCRAYPLANGIHLQIEDSDFGIGENIGQAGTNWEPFGVTMDKRRIYVFFRCWKPRKSPIDIDLRDLPPQSWTLAEKSPRDGKPRDMPLHW